MFILVFDLDCIIDNLMKRITLVNSIKLERKKVKISEMQLYTALTKWTGLSFFDPLVETRSVEFMHTQDFSDSLSFVNRVIANSTVFIKIVTGKVRHKPDFISLGILLVEEIQICIAKNKVECKIQ